MQRASHMLLFREIEHRLLYSPIIIPRYGFHYRSTDLADKPIHRFSGPFVNKLQILFCDRALLMSSFHNIANSFKMILES